MNIAPASRIEGHWRIFIISSLLFVIVFNPYNVDSLLYGAPIYSDIYIFPYLVYWIEAYIKLLIFVLFLLH